jgi:nucleoside 2-deoxyribosyltransferase
MLICPLCSNKYSDHDQPFKRHIGDFFYCECINCGSFKVSEIVWDENFDGQLNDIVKIRISYDVRQYSDAHESQGSNRFFLISQKYIAERRVNFTLPNPTEQANNLIKFIGSELNKTIDEIEMLPKNLYLKIGAKSPHYCGQIVKELFNRKDIVGIQSEAADTPFTVLLPNLSLSGWEKYEAEKKGKFSGNYAFIAYKFDQPDFESILNNHIKQIIPKRFNLDVRDMKGHTEAGIIYNIMRQQIRDCAFVIADLTHKNNGAYWEAGYAEGLGKPVIYTCNEDVFQSDGTHIDTNHCTTLMWNNDKDDLIRFEDTLVATIRRSLNYTAND